jgi:hypothetical protein
MSVNEETRLSDRQQTYYTQAYDPAMFKQAQGQELMQHSLTSRQPEEPKKSTCEKIGKKTCDVIFSIVMILIIVALCWWMFQICSDGGTEDDDDESPFCQILGDVGQLLGDAAHVIAVALNNFFWLLGLLGLYGIYKISGSDFFKDKAEDAKDKVKTPDEGDTNGRQPAERNNDQRDTEQQNRDQPGKEHEHVSEK